MGNLSDRFADWLATYDDTETPATPAATVLMLRDTEQGPEVLMVQRSAQGTFASNWVFPGGKLDSEDYADGDDVVAASRRAAIREAQEEADVVVDGAALVPFSHWMPPIVVPRRFSTWFFLTASPGGVDADVSIDGSEIVDHVWVRPADALAKHGAGEVELVPPTWVTLRHLATFESTVDALRSCQTREPFFYLTKLISSEPTTLAWHGDAGYETADLSAPGARHRLEMHSDGWRFYGP